MMKQETIKKRFFSARAARSLASAAGRGAAVLIAAVTMLTLTAQTARATDIVLNLSVDDDYDEGTDGRYYVNMPEFNNTGLLTLDGSITTFKVYDDGGKYGNYSQNYWGEISIHAPGGYIIQVTGGVSAYNGITNSQLIFYNDDDTQTQPLKTIEAGGYWDGDFESIGTVTSRGNVMKIRFIGAQGTTDPGLDFTVKIIDNTSYFPVTVANPATGGTVASDKSTAKWKETVTLTATPAEGYVLSGISVNETQSGKAVNVDGQTFGSTATFQMPDKAVTVTPTFTNDLTANSLSVNLPATGTKTVNIPSGVKSLKVYDDGGPGGSYSDNCDGTLVLNVPEGYVLRLSGSIDTESNCDELTVYDNGEASGTKLVDGESGSKQIEAVTSSGQSMTICFSSDYYETKSGLDLTVVIYNPNETYDITVANATGGTVTSIKSAAKWKETVTLTAEPAGGYVLSGLSVKDADNEEVDVDWTVWANSATFTMPDKAVSVTPTFTNDMTSLAVNLPKTGTKTTATIPDGVTSIKVYDDGGPDGYYSNGCSGSLVITAPEGKRLKVTGTIMTNYRYDQLSVYDGSSTASPALISGMVSDHGNNSEWWGKETAIRPATTSGNTVTIYFYSNNENNGPGLDLTVTIDDPTTAHNVSVAAATGGTVAASPAQAVAGQTVTLTAEPAGGYVLSGISVTNGSNPIATDWDLWANTAKFTMPAADVTVTPTFTNNLTNLSVNIPSTGSMSACIPTGVKSIKVYDSAGPNGSYSGNKDGTLVLTCPEGYLMQISGRIATRTTHYMNVYDSDHADNDKILLNQVHSTKTDDWTDIATVSSTGNAMTIFFYANDGYPSIGLDLTVIIYDPNEIYGITVNNTTGGSVASDKSTAYWNETITLTAEPAEGYVLSALSVKDADNKEVAVEWAVWANSATFTMPNKAVTVAPTFTNNMTSLAVNMPVTGTKTTATIPEGVTSFKVYDDESDYYHYSNNCDGTLVLTAPEGYVLQLSGHIWTQKNKDCLTVYDSDHADNDKKLLDNVSSSSDDTKTAIQTVTSTGRSMTLYFKSDGSTNYTGLDLTATLKKPLTHADITIAAIADQTWTGGAIEPTIVVKDGTTDITDQCNIVVTNNTNAGEATVTITAKAASAGYAGSTSTTFQIVPKPVTDANITNSDTEPTIALTQDQNGTTATLDGASDGSVSITADVAVEKVKLGRTFNNGQKTAICWPFEVTASEAAGLGTFYEFKGINTEGKIEMQVVSTDLAANTPYIFEPKADITDAIDFGAKTLKAGGPASVGSGFTFKGIYGRVRWTTDTSDPLYNAGHADELGSAYGFALETKTDLNGKKTYSPGQFVMLGEGAHSRAFRAYMLYDGAWDGNEPTAAARRATRGMSLPNTIDIVWLTASGQTTGISTISPFSDSDTWYSLDGRRLSGKPTKKGLYIHNGKKVTIK